MLLGVVARLIHQRARLLDGIVEALFDGGVAEDDALQRGVPQVGKGDPVGKQRRREEVLRDCLLYTSRCV